MLSVYVKGGTKKKRELVEEIIDFCVLELNLNRLYLDIQVKLGKTENCDGYVIWNDDNVRPREFEMEVRKDQEESDFITTVMHEMVHVKQYARGELKERYKDGHRQLWKGKDHSETDYFDQPWEREAYRLQEVLYKKYLKAKGA